MTIECLVIGDDGDDGRPTIKFRYIELANAFPIPFILLSTLPPTSLPMRLAVLYYKPLD